ncbi:MAG: type IX secretion system sortase PorU [candidate division Zixibacteria bacterium]|nr:type IX secretion system sortase PorU [candidate division Zixibacteria bacterium]
MGKRLTLLIVTALAAGITQATEYGDIEIVRADEKGILFEYRPVHVRLELAETFDTATAGKPVRRLAISNCARTTAVGGYDLPVRIVLVGIPPDARPEVMVFASGENGFTAPDAAMNGSMADRERLKAVEDYTLDEEKRGVENRVVPDRPFWIGNQRVLRLKLFPARYDEAAGAYRVVEKLQVEVRLNSLEKFVSSATRNAWDRVLRNGILNYEQAKAFRGRPEAVGKLAQAAAFTSPFGPSSNWVRVSFNENGIYRIDRNMLSAAGVPVSSIDPRTIRMFCQGGRALPAFNNVPRPDWRELAIEVTGEQDGVFDAGDQVRFYGWGVEGWDYDTLGGAFSFRKNNYITSQAFWLTWGGTFGGSAVRVDSQSVPPAGAPLVTSFPARFRLESDRFLAADNLGEINDYYNWYGGKGTTQTYFFNLPDLVPGADTIGIKHLSGGIVSLRVNGRLASPLGAVSGVNLFQTDTLKTGLNRVDITLGTTSIGFNYFDFLEAQYNRAPVYSAPLLEFERPTVSGMVEFQISNSPNNFVLWDITNRSLPAVLTGAVRNGSGVLSFDVDAATMRILVLTSIADFKQPALSRQTPLDLTGSNQGEFIIIAPAAFRSALSSYAAHRAAHSGVVVQQVDVEQIYNNFAGGLPDPVAIRDFLKFARENWSDPKPRFVLLAGDATYDFRNLLGTATINFVPPFIVDQAFDSSSNSDEGFLYFGNPGILDSADQFLDMTIARWPVKNVSELQVIADKIRGYEASPEYGGWRNRVTLVADDEFAGSSQTQGFHTAQTEEMDGQHLPPQFDRNKIYLFDYPFDGLRHKPEAEEAIVKAWNEGHLLIDYVGHGNPSVWAHERVFKREEGVPRLVNGARLPLVYAASCEINTFVEPLADGMGEDLMKNPNGGAVAVIAAVRLVFAGANTDLNYKVFDLLFASDSLSIGEAFYLAKLLRQYTGFSVPHPISNDRRYVLFGDPAMHLARPTYNVRLIVPDSLSALGVAAVSGEVTDAAGNVITGFGGTVTLSVFDGLRFKSHPLAGAPEIRVDYALPGNMIYRGEAVVSAGRFQFQFVVPKDISYGSRTGRISAYGWDSSADAAGHEDSIPFSGSAAATNDTVGPIIILAASGGAALQPGEAVSVGVSLSVKLEDSSGINITGDPAHTITADFDFPSGPGLDLTGSFRYDAGSFSSGAVTFTVPELAAGSHTVRIKAWDGANNSSVLVTPLEVVAAEKLKLSGVLNYPNPMKEKTNFCYTLSAAADEVVIEIFSLAGRAVRTIRSTATRPGYNFDTAWDGLDNDGDRVASGVYIYKVRARQASKETEEFGKLVVMR